MPGFDDLRVILYLSQVQQTQLTCQSTRADMDWCHAAAGKAGTAGWKPHVPAAPLADWVRLRFEEDSRLLQ